MNKYTKFAGHIMCVRNANYCTCKKCKNSDGLTPSSDLNGIASGKLHGNRLDSSDHCVHPHLQEIVDEINQNCRIMICMRGAPGSGKSYLARTIIDRTVNGGNYSEHIFSADDYFYDQQTGNYNYVRNRLRQAHNANKLRVARRAQSGWSPIIVDNTNIKLWEMFAYVKDGIRNGYAIKVLEPNTTWAKSIDELALRNKHKVDRVTIQRMLSMYEPGSVADILNALNLCPTSPTPRNFPEIRGSNDGDCASENR